MPQIAKGGKYIFGWSKIRENGEILIPEEAVLEYGFEMNGKVILISASKTSGGFIIARKKTLEQSKINFVLIQNPELAKFQIEEGSVINFNRRLYCWVRFHKNGLLTLPLSACMAFEIKPGDYLLSARGSGLAIAMVVKGPIIEEAKKHPEIKLFS